jgi:DNA-binding response OmpR family regulator
VPNKDNQLIPGDPDRWQIANEPGGTADSSGGTAGLPSSAVGTLLVRPPTSYRHAFGDKPIRLGAIEFQILLFLASRPYHAFTPKQVANAVAKELKTSPIEQSALDGHVANLREQLGVLSDFVQTVPGVGWRYKA